MKELQIVLSAQISDKFAKRVIKKGISSTFVVSNAIKVEDMEFKKEYFLKFKEAKVV